MTNEPDEGSRADGAAGQDPAVTLREAYGAFRALVATVTDERSWRETECTGWAVRDLIFHCVGDAQRGLVALHTPAARPADRDACSYWADWQPAVAGTGANPGAAAGAAAGRRFVRVVAGMYLNVGNLCALADETAAAVVHAASVSDREQLVETQSHVLTAGDLMRTLIVEVTIHHLDFAVGLPDAPGPAPAGLAEVRRTLDGLLGHPVPVRTWDDATYARKATGRRPLSDAERALLGPDAARFPLFG